MSVNVVVRVCAVLVKQTHTQTAYESILPEGTGVINDVGMTCPYDGFLGVELETIINLFITNLPSRFEVVKNTRTQLNGFVVTIDEGTGKSTKVERILINDDHPYFG